MVCSGKHIANPIPIGEWGCPKCGSKDFIIEDPENPDCEKDHVNDYVFCNECRYSAVLAVITRNYWKKKGINYAKCPHCNGTGQIEEK